MENLAWREFTFEDPLTCKVPLMMSAESISCVKIAPEEHFGMPV